MTNHDSTQPAPQVDPGEMLPLILDVAEALLRRHGLEN